MILSVPFLVPPKTRFGKAVSTLVSVFAFVASTPAASAPEAQNQKFDLAAITSVKLSKRCDADVWLFSTATGVCHMWSAGCADDRTKFASEDSCMERRVPASFESVNCYRFDPLAQACVKEAAPKEKICVHPSFPSQKSCTTYALHRQAGI